MAIKKTKVRTNLPYIEACNAICMCLTVPKDEGKMPDPEVVRLLAESDSPFEEGEYACGYEALGQTETEVTYLVAIASEERLTAQPWYPTLKSRHQLGRCRIDVSVLAWLEALREQTPALTQGAHFVFLQTEAETLLMLVRQGVLVNAHAFSTQESIEDPTMMMRELMRFLALNGEHITSAYLYASTPAEALSLKALLKEMGVFETINDILLPAEMATAWLQQGLSKRAAAKTSMNVTPQSWRDLAKKQQKRFLAILGGLFVAILWGACATYFILWPMQKEQELKLITAEYKALEGQYNEFETMRDRVELIERYKDRSNSALEILRLVCAAKPKGVTFLSLNFQQKRIIKISANAETPADVYAFKDALEQAFAVDPDAEEPSLRPAATPEIVRFVEDRKTGLQRIDVDIKFELPEEEE
jgi:hypothetical protein